MLKQHILKLMIGLAVVLTLLGGVAFGTGAAATAKAAPTQHLLACGGGWAFPPCD